MLQAIFTKELGRSEMKYFTRGKLSPTRDYVNLRSLNERENFQMNIRSISIEREGWGRTYQRDIGKLARTTNK